MDTGSQLLLNVSTLQGTVKLGSKATEIVAFRVADSVIVLLKYLK